MGSFMTNSKGLTKNPLGIIALFVSLIYGFACLVLSTNLYNLKTEIERLPLIWFIILFPIIILLAFVFLVIKHHGKLYSPSDYGDNESFLKTLEGARKFEPIQVELTDNKLNNAISRNELVKKSEDINLNKGIFSSETKENVKLFNQFSRYFLELVNKKPYRDQFSKMSFGAQAPEYFIFSVELKKESLKETNIKSEELIIIRITEDKDGILNLIAIGKDIIEKDSRQFAIRVNEHVDSIVNKTLKEEFLK